MEFEVEESICAKFYAVFDALFYQYFFLKITNNPKSNSYTELLIKRLT